MSITINSIIDTKNDFWEVSLAGELDVSTADELKKSLHKLVDEKNIDMKLNLENLDYNHLNEEAQKHSNYRILSNKMYFYGICEECQNKHE